MINSYTKQEMMIRNYREGKNPRRTACQFQPSRKTVKTVKKYVEEYEELILRSESPSIARFAAPRSINVDFGRDYAFIFKRHDTIAFLESHARFFETVDGVYHKKTYGNIRVAIAKYIDLHEKEPTKVFLQLCGHYGLSHRFCNAYRENDRPIKQRMIVIQLPKSMRIKCPRVHSNIIDLEGLREYDMRELYDICGQEIKRSIMKYVTVHIRAPALDGTTKSMGFFKA